MVDSACCLSRGWPRHRLPKTTTGGLPAKDAVGLLAQGHEVASPRKIHNRIAPLQPLLSLEHGMWEKAPSFVS